MSTLETIPYLSEATLSGLGISTDDVIESIEGLIRGGDAGTGHAAEPVGPAGLIAPRAAAVLAILPILGGSAPSGRVYLCADPLCLVQCQHGELRIAIVPSSARRPHSWWPPSLFGASSQAVSCFC